MNASFGSSEVDQSTMQLIIDQLEELVVTLIEEVRERPAVAVAILAAVSGGVLTLFTSNSIGATLNGDQSTAMSDAASALRSMSADLSAASGFGAPGHAGGVRVIFAGGSTLEFYQEGTALKRVVVSDGSAATVVVTGLASGAGLSITYYDTGMNVIAGPMDSAKYSQATAADLSIVIALAHGSGGQVRRTTRVVLRNRVS